MHAHARTRTHTHTHKQNTKPKEKQKQTDRSKVRYHSRSGGSVKFEGPFHIGYRYGLTTLTSQFALSGMVWGVGVGSGCVLVYAVCCATVGVCVCVCVCVFVCLFVCLCRACNLFLIVTLYRLHAYLFFAFRSVNIYGSWPEYLSTLARKLRLRR